MCWNFLCLHLTTLQTRAVGGSFKPGGPMVESKPQMKHFTAFAIDFPQNRVGQAHLAHTLTTPLHTEESIQNERRNLKTEKWTTERQIFLHKSRTKVRYLISDNRIGCAEFAAKNPIIVSLLSKNLGRTRIHISYWIRFSHYSAHLSTIYLLSSPLLMIV